MTYMRRGSENGDWQFERKQEWVKRNETNT